MKTFLVLCLLAFFIALEACPEGSSHTLPGTCGGQSAGGECQIDSDCQPGAKICCFRDTCETFCTHPDGTDHPGK